MNAWLPVLDMNMLSPSAAFAAGVIVVTALQCALLLWSRRAARRRDLRRPAMVTPDPRRMLEQLHQLRSDCDNSMGELEFGIGRLRAKALARGVEFRGRAREVQDLRHALDEKAGVIESLETRLADLELWKERNLLELQRKESALAARADALATADQTIAIMRAMLDIPGRPAIQVPQRAAG